MRNPIDPTPRVGSRYGAPMGRANSTGYTITEQAVPVRLVHCPLNSGGYDRGGAYWGIGAPLYYFEASPAGLVSGYVRGRTREAAKLEVRKLYPKARFYR